MYAEDAVQEVVYLGLHVIGRGDICLPMPAIFDGQAYSAEFIMTEQAISSVFHSSVPKYDAVSMYDSRGHQIEIVATPKPRYIAAGDTTRARISVGD